MPSERQQRQIDRFLDQMEEAASREDWSTARARAENVLTLDADNVDAARFITVADQRLAHETTGA